jgi:hypothetical protein
MLFYLSVAFSVGSPPSMFLMRNDASCTETCLTVACANTTANDVVGQVSIGTNATRPKDKNERRRTRTREANALISVRHYFRLLIV